MRVKARYSAHQVYRPDWRYKETKERYETKSMEVEVKEVTEEEFPLAFVVHEMKYVNETAKYEKDFRRQEEKKIFSEEIRAFGGRLFRPIRISFISYVSLVYAPLRCLSRKLSNVQYFCEDFDFFTDDSVIIESDDEEQQEKVRRKAESYVVFGGVAWEECGEPAYRIFTDRTAEEGTEIELKIVYFLKEDKFDLSYLSVLPNIFNARERDEAVKRAEKLTEKEREKGREKGKEASTDRGRAN